MFSYWENPRMYSESTNSQQNTEPQVNPLANALEKYLIPFEYSCSKVAWLDDNGQNRTDVFISAQSDVRREASLEETMSALKRIQEQVWGKLQGKLAQENHMQAAPEITKIGRRNRSEMHYGQIALMDRNMRIIIVPHGDRFLPHTMSRPGSRKYRELARGITSNRLQKTLHQERQH